MFDFKKTQKALGLDNADLATLCRVHIRSIERFRAGSLRTPTSIKTMMTELEAKLPKDVRTLNKCNDCVHRVQFITVRKTLPYRINICMADPEEDDYAGGQDLYEITTFNADKCLLYRAITNEGEEQ